MGTLRRQSWLGRGRQRRAPVPPSRMWQRHLPLENKGTTSSLGGGEYPDDRVGPGCSAVDVEGAVPGGQYPEHFLAREWSATPKGRPGPAHPPAPLGRGPARSGARFAPPHELPRPARPGARLGVGQHGKDDALGGPRTCAPSSPFPSGRAPLGRRIRAVPSARRRPARLWTSPNRPPLDLDGRPWTSTSAPSPPEVVQVGGCSSRSPRQPVSLGGRRARRCWSTRSRALDPARPRNQPSPTLLERSGSSSPSPERSAAESSAGRGRGGTTSRLRWPMRSGAVAA